MTQRNAEFQSYANKWQVAKDTQRLDFLVHKEKIWVYSGL